MKSEEGAANPTTAPSATESSTISEATVVKSSAVQAQERAQTVTALKEKLARMKQMYAQQSAKT